MGTDYLEMKGNATTCPLCSHDHGTFIELNHAIQSANKVNGQGDSNLDELRQSIESLQADIVLLNEKIEHQNLNRRNAEHVVEAYNALANDLQFDINSSLQKPEDQLQSIHNLLAIQNEWKRQLEIIENQLQVFDETGFSNTEIIRAEL
ncbi:hypothetical protein, partial [Halorubrum sp. Atlit-9R]|uniref:hypothetical protein n=1 Tax=Halorubrum sp. Atlit-9R TaxID=2282127 RepID=UPI0011C3E5EA